MTVFLSHPFIVVMLWYRFLLCSQLCESETFLFLRGVSLANGLSILSIFSENQLLAQLTLVFLLPVECIPALVFPVPFLCALGQLVLEKGSESTLGGKQPPPWAVGTQRQSASLHRAPPWARRSTQNGPASHCGAEGCRIVSEGEPPGSMQVLRHDPKSVTDKRNA